MSTRSTTRRARSDALRKGFARWSASTQQFLDTCPAVVRWAPTNDGKFVVFVYNTTIEVPLTPPGVYFDPDRADEDEREELAASLRWPRRRGKR